MCHGADAKNRRPGAPRGRPGTGLTVVELFLIFLLDGHAAVVHAWGAGPNGTIMHEFAPQAQRARPPPPQDSAKRNVTPGPPFLSTHNRPPCASMIERLIDNPIPRP